MAFLECKYLLRNAHPYTRFLGQEELLELLQFCVAGGLGAELGAEFRVSAIQFLPILLELPQCCDIMYGETGKIGNTRCDWIPR
jgi:hypothetical protein